MAKLTKLNVDWQPGDLCMYQGQLREVYERDDGKVCLRPFGHNVQYSWWTGQSEERTRPTIADLNIAWAAEVEHFAEQSRVHTARCSRLEKAIVELNKEVPQK